MILYTEDMEEEKNVTVPDVSGMSASNALRVLVNSGLNIKFAGAYREDVGGSVAQRQTPAAGELVKPGTTIEVEFIHTDNTD